MADRPEPADDYERKLLAQIDRFGWSVTSVFDPEGDLPPFSYSIGIFETLRAPELLIIGLRHETGHGLVNDYGDRVRAGESFVPGHRYKDFIEGFDIAFLRADAASTSADYTRSASWLYGGTDFPLLQMVWPDKQGRFPWEGWPSSLSRQQPLFGEPPT